MTVKEMAAACDFEIINLPETDEEVGGVYACDLLSWVIGRATEKAALVTVMTNVNVIAVSVMADLSCVVLCEGVTPDEVARQRAVEQGVAVLSSKLPAYETCLKIGAVL